VSGTGIAAGPGRALVCGNYLDPVPGVGSLSLSGEPRPEPGHPGLTARQLSSSTSQQGA